VSEDITSVRVLLAASTIRWYLPDLVDRSEVSRFDQLIAELLASPDDSGEVEEQLRHVLSIRPGTKAWLSQVLDDEDLLPPELQAVEERAVDPIGRATPVGARRFVCPHGDYIWYQRSVSQRPPQCPTHGNLAAR
jgi:hypothetical protein